MPDLDKKMQTPHEIQSNLYPPPKPSQAMRGAKCGMGKILFCNLFAIADF